MKTQILIFLGIVTFIFVGCGGGGGGTSINYDNPNIIENQDFYRVKLADLGEKYIKEVFDGNVTLYEDTYLINDELDTNRTIAYYTDLLYVYIEDDPAIRCRVIDSNASVEFWCLKADASGTLSLYTTRWKTLEDAMAHPED